MSMTETHIRYLSVECQFLKSELTCHERWTASQMIACASPLSFAFVSYSSQITIHFQRTTWLLRSSVSVLFLPNNSFHMNYKYRIV